MSEAVRIVRDGPVLTVLIDRPDVRNAVDRPTADALARAFHVFEMDRNAAVAVLAGAGETFCAGADLKAFAHALKDRQSRMEAPMAIRDDRNAPMGPTRLILSKPVIAAVERHAVGGGFELALWCDMRVVAEDAVMGVFNRRFGVPLIDGGTVRLPRLIGHSRAMDLILTGRAVGGREAFRIGLANRLAASGEALAVAQNLAMGIARFPQTCLRSDRLSAIEQWDHGHHEAMANEWRRGRAVVESGEARQGAVRFTHGRGRGGDREDF